MHQHPDQQSVVLCKLWIYIAHCVRKHL